MNKELISDKSNLLVHVHVLARKRYFEVYYWIFEGGGGGQIPKKISALKKYRAQINI